jgi:chitodextrinase
LAGEASAAVTTSDAVRWTADRVFVAGDEVAADGEIFRARWWTQGVQPQADPDSPFDHPWEYVGPAPEELQGPALSAQAAS